MTDVDNIFGPLIPAGKSLPPYYGPVGTEMITGMQSAEGRQFDALIPGSVAAGVPTTASQKAALDKGAQNVMTAAFGFAGSSAPGEGIIAYHGSPYDFDKFDASKIGTGEGAQAYGHGLYFAGNEAVAKGYRDALANKAPVDLGQPANTQGLILLRNGIQDARMRGSTPAERTAAFQNWMDETEQMANGKYAPAGMADGVKEAKQLLASGQVVPDFSSPAGRMYQVRLNTDPNALLDWDKPLSQQSPIIQQKIQNLSNRSIAPRNLDPDLTGAELYQELAHKLGPSSRVAQALAEPLPGGGPNVPGIQYLDAGSRAAGDGTSNYVMFDPALIDILRKYGIAGLMVGGGAVGAGNIFSPLLPNQQVH